PSRGSIRRPRSRPDRTRHGMDDTKRTIRQEMRRRRRALSAAERDAVGHAVAAHAGGLDPFAHAAGLAAFAAAPCVIAYVASDGEVPTAALVETAFAAGKRVYFPCLIGDTIHFAEHRRGGDLRPRGRGMLEPLGDRIDARDLAEAVAFVPLLAWDETGRRVGRGGGHYDRAFTGATRPASLVGLGYTF